MMSPTLAKMMLVLRS